MLSKSILVLYDLIRKLNIHFVSRTNSKDPIYFFFFFKDPPPTEISPLPLHDALPIGGRRVCDRGSGADARAARRGGGGGVATDRGDSGRRGVAGAPGGTPRRGRRRGAAGRDDRPYSRGGRGGGARARGGGRGGPIGRAQ